MKFTVLIWTLASYALFAVILAGVVLGVCHELRLDYAATQAR